MISHSLGASASAKYFQNNPDRNIHLTTYGAPFISMSNKNNDNYTSARHFGDIVSMLDHQHSLYGDTGKDVSRSIEPVKDIL